MAMAWAMVCLTGVVRSKEISSTSGSRPAATAESATEVSSAQPMAAAPGTNRTSAAPTAVRARVAPSVMKSNTLDKNPIRLASPLPAR